MSTESRTPAGTPAGSSVGNSAFLRVEGLAKTYPGAPEPVFDSVHFGIERGGFVVIIVRKQHIIHHTRHAHLWQMALNGWAEFTGGRAGNIAHVFFAPGA